jgi:hypothetical protein
MDWRRRPQQMARPSEAHFEAATRLLQSAQPSASGGSAEAAAAAHVYDALFRAVAPVLGATGFRALFARALKLSQDEFPCLQAIRVRLEPPESEVQIAGDLLACLSQLEPDAASQAATGLYAAFLGLLSSFIGDQLVWQIVKRALPAMGETSAEETE